MTAPANGDSKLGYHASAAWLKTLEKILRDGAQVAPRGMRTLEVQQHTTKLHLAHPVVLVPGRKASYSFMAAEALWILSGDDRLESIAPYNPNIAKFSDDGVRLAGAYGAPVVDQLPYVVRKLIEDRDTRQAVMTIWRPNPKPSKDIPCTVAIAFSIRDSRLNCHVFMRSSDAWLGLPYDVFFFSMLAAKVACAYNLDRVKLAIDAPGDAKADVVSLGWLWVTAASEHLYAENFEAAKACVDAGIAPRGEPVPESWVAGGSWRPIEDSVLVCRDKLDPATAGEVALWRIRP